MRPPSCDCHPHGPRGRRGVVPTQILGGSLPSLLVCWELPLCAVRPCTARRRPSCRRPCSPTTRHPHELLYARGGGLLPGLLEPQEVLQPLQLLPGAVGPPSLLQHPRALVSFPSEALRLLAERGTLYLCPRSFVFWAGRMSGDTWEALQTLRTLCATLALVRLLN